MNSCYPDDVVVRFSRFEDGRRWFKLEHYFRVVTSKGTFTVPTGFETDCASIPGPFTNILNPQGEYARDAIFHDWAYSKASTGHFPNDRKMADLVFKELMFNSGIGWLKRETIFRAVRLFGNQSYKQR